MTDLPADPPTEGLRVVALLPVRPDAVEEAGRALATLAAASRERDTGCLAYDAFESTSAPGTLVTVEAWATQADLDAHLAAPHVAEAFAVLGPALAGEVAIHTLRPL